MYHILYVDDEPGLLEIGKLFLEQSGQFSVDVITSAPAALALLGTKNYDAIISDYQMPGMDGIEFLKTIRTSGNTIPFVLFTGKGREEIVIQALNEGADFYLQKGGKPSAMFAELTHKVLSAVEHHRSVERIKSLNRLYSVLSATNKAIVKISTKEEFFSEICRILVETGGFCMAWIGLADPEHMTIRPAASAGPAGEYLDHIRISTKDVPLGRGPTGTAYRQGNCYFSNDITRDPNMEPWLESALNHGYRANAALPFSLGTKNAGVLSLYAPVSGFFDDEIISLLKELADAISFALRTIDDQAERKAADAALRESEERFRTLYINMTEGAALHEIVYTDKGIPDDYIILEINPAFEKQLGISRTAVIGKTSREAYGVAWPPYLDIYSDVALTGKPVAFETYFAPMDKYFSISVYSPKEGRFATIFDDITERKKAEHALQEKTAELEDYFSRSLYLSCIADTDGHFRRLNSEWEKTLGYTLADLEGSRFLDFVHPDDQPRTLAVIGDLVNKKNVVDFTNRFRHKDGSYRWIEWRSYPNPKNNLIFATARDITRQKETEETLQNVNDLLKGVIESPAGVVIFALDRQYRYIAFNENHRRTMKQIWGTDIAFGTSMLAYIQDPGDRAKATINFNRALAGESFTVTEVYGDTNLERRWYENAYNPIMDKNGTINGLTLFLTDITERKKAKDALRQNEENYQSIIEALPDAVSIIDKDFKVTFANANLLSWLHGIGQNNDIIGRTLLDAFPFLSSTVLDEYRTVFLKGKIIISQESARIGDTEIVTETHKIPIENNGEIVAVLAIIRNITDRQQAEKALRESEEKLRAIFDSTFHFTGLLTPEGIMIEANRTALDFAGARLEDVVNHPFWETVWWGGDTARIRRLKEAIHKAAGGIFVRYETEFVGAGNSSMMVDFSLKPVFDSTGRIRLLITEARDITESKQVEAALRESEEKYRNIIENAPYGMHFYELKPEKGLIFTGANPGADDILGVRHDQFIGKTLEEAFPGLASTEVPARYREAAESGSVWHTEQVLYDNGSISGAYAVTAFQTAPGSMAAMFIDITLQKRTEEALRQSEEKFRGIFDTINDGIHIHEITSDGKPGKFIEVNEAACRMLEYTREELLEHGPLDFVTEYHSRPFDAIIAELSATGHSIFETGHRRKDGTIIPVEINSHVVNLFGKTVGVTVIRDITERRKVSDALRLANRQLILLTGITRHDILNNVSTARGYLKIAEMKSGDPAQAEYLRKMESAIIAIKSQVEFTRVYQDLGTHAPQWIVLDTVMPRVQVPKTLTLNADIQGVLLFADPMLEKVFSNLLDNSIRHGQRVTEIRVSSQKSGEDLVVVWEDNGTGVAADEKERIFERGYGKNTGLGLFLVREILFLTGITIAETGEPGKGARFEMTVTKGSYRFVNPVKE